MIKVLFVIQALSNGGAEKSIVNLLNELPCEKYEIDLLLFSRTGMFLNQVPKWMRIIDTPDELEKLFLPIAKSGRMIATKVIGTGMSRIREKEPHRRAAYRWSHFYGRKIPSLKKKYDAKEF